MTHPARRVEERWNAVLTRQLEGRGWHPVVVPHVGYAGTDFVRVLARVLLVPDGWSPTEEQQALRRRGWRNFFTAEASDCEVTVTIDGQRHRVTADRGGHVDVRLPNPGLPPGWQQVQLSAGGRPARTARILVVGDDVRFGLVSDIDDTVLRTLLPRPLVAAYRTFVLTEGERQVVAGMPELYASLLADHPGAPTVYLSTGAWNIAAPLRRFVARHGLPAGPLLLTDWGPTNTGWFRSGREHKEHSLAALIADFPEIRWVLVGDDGQHDPEIYTEFAREHPDRVRAVLIRSLGLSRPRTALTPPADVPYVSAADGAALIEALGELDDGQRARLNASS